MKGRTLLNFAEQVRQQDKVLAERMVRLYEDWTQEIEEVSRVQFGKKGPQGATAAGVLDQDYLDSTEAADGKLKTVSDNFIDGYTLKMYDWGGARQYFLLDSASSKKVLATVHVYRYSDVAWRVETTGVRPSQQGQKLGVRLYAGLVKDLQMNLISGKKQSVGGELLWRALSQQPGVSVYGYNTETKELVDVDLDQNFGFDSATGTVYTSKADIEQLKAERRQELNQAASEQERAEIRKAYDQELRDQRAAQKILLVATPTKGLKSAK